MITFDGVTKDFRTGRGRMIPILSRIDLAIRKQEFVCILGPSGCGKTTLLNLAAGFIFPTRGQVLVDGHMVAGPGPDRGVVFQESTLFPWLTVKKNIEFGLKLKGAGRATLDRTVKAHLKIMGLSDHAHKHPHTLSGGMRQRVAIARVLALEPKVLLMDEPFSALDANTRERLQDELLRIWKSLHQTIVYVTHSVEEAAYLADRVIIMGRTPACVHADIPVTLQRPRRRSTPEFSGLTEQLRKHLGTQPCCIQPILTIGG